MTINDYLNEIRMELTGGILHMEMKESDIQQLIEISFREVQRYCDYTQFITLDYAPCIDLTEYNPIAVFKVLRAVTPGSVKGNQSPLMDPMWITAFGQTNSYSLRNTIDKYSAYMIASQIRNTISTDLSYNFSNTDNLLYVNCSSSAPAKITIELNRRPSKIEDITDEYWVDILQRMSIARVKIALGRIRTRYTQSNALWVQDGEKLLEEGTRELTELRETLRVNNLMFFVRD
jgi:hypothetical protein